MSALTRFPSRIRFVNPDGTLTVEAARMLDMLVLRVGDDLGDNGIDIFSPASAGDGAVALAPEVHGVASPAGHMAVEVAGIASPPGHLAPISLQPGSQPAGFTEMTFQGNSE